MLEIMSGAEMMAHTTENCLKKSIEDIEKDPVKKAAMEQWGPESENGLKLAEAFKEIMAKYTDDMVKLSSQEFLHATDLLAEKCRGDKSSPNFLKEFLVLRAQYAPNLLNMDKEMREAQKKLGMPDYL